MTKTFFSVALIAGALLLVSCGGSDSKPAASSTQATQAPSSQSQQAAAATAPATAAPQAKSAQSTSGKLNPCDLLTKAAAEAAGGLPMKDGVPEDSKNPLGQQLCGYSTSKELTVRYVQLSVVTDGNLSKDLKDRKYSVKKLFTDTRQGEASISGVGEDAFMQGDRSIHVLQKDVYFSLSITGGGFGAGNATVTQQTLTTLAQSVLEQLPRQ